MKAIIRLDVPDWQIGEEVTVYFPDTMMTHGICEALNPQPKKSEESRCQKCGKCFTE